MRARVPLPYRRRDTRGGGRIMSLKDSDRPAVPTNWPEIAGQALANLPSDEFEDAWSAIGKSVRMTARAKADRREAATKDAAPLAEAWVQQAISPLATRRRETALAAFQAGFVAARSTANCVDGSGTRP